MTRPWRDRLLWASLAANLFLVALVGAHLLHRRPPRPGLEGTVHRLARALPPADADRFRVALERERPRYDRAYAEMDAARAELARAIGRTPYDERQVRDTLRVWQGHWQTVADRFADALLVAAGDLSPEGRARLADAARPPPRR